MNEEIKFKAWHTKLQRMFSPEEMANDQMTLLPTGKFINVHSVPQMSRIIEEMIPLQFTNFQDKNGKEICKGDIVRLFFPEQEFADGNSPELEEFRVVTFEEGGFCAGEGFYLGNLSSECWEVVGNIYQNPELLEVLTK